MGVAENIEFLMRKHGINQEAIARIAGVSQSAVSGWMHGKNPSNKSMRLLCEHFNLEPNDIMSDKFGLAAYGTTPRIPGAIPPVYEPRRAYAPLLGMVHAGDADEPQVLDDRIPIPYEVWESHKNGYFLKVEGDCMDKVYPPGCYVFIDPDMPPQTGSIAVASIDTTDYIMRRLFLGANTAVLSPESFDEQWKDIVIGEGHELALVGTVVWFQAAEEMS